MKRIQLLAAIIGLAWAAGHAAAYPPRWSVGVSIGGPPYPYYYRPYPYYYYPPPPVVVAPAPIFVPAQPVVVTAPAPTPTVVTVPAPTPAVATTPAPALQFDSARPATYETPATAVTVDAHLANLRNADEVVRRNSVMDLGRMRATQAVEPLTATLAGDRAPAVRDAAARALGLIGSPRALTALMHAAQADPDRDVRNSAQFAVEIIRTNPR